MIDDNGKRILNADAALRLAEELEQECQRLRLENVALTEMNRQQAAQLAARCSEVTA